MKTYLYVRVSTRKQDHERQIRSLKKVYPDGIIVRETYTGRTMDRKEWTRLFQRAQAGDIIAFDSVSRMSRNAEEGFAAYEDLYRRGVELVFLNEPYINTDTYKGAVPQIPETADKDLNETIMSGLQEYLLRLAKRQLYQAFEQAEKEVLDISQRIKGGMETARLAGKRIGRAPGARPVTKKSLAAKEILKKHCKEFGGSLSDAETMALAGLSRNTFYKYKRELKEETGAD